MLVCRYVRTVRTYVRACVRTCCALLVGGRMAQGMSLNASSTFVSAASGLNNAVSNSQVAQV